MWIFTRSQWDGTPRELGELFAPKKGRVHRAKCIIVTHSLGLELRLPLNGELHRSQVFREDARLLDEGDAWKSALEVRGWR